VQRTRLVALCQHPICLMLCAVIGLIFGAWAPDSLGWLRLISDLYVNLLSMAATPLVVVAVFFGLRQTLALPTPKRRLLLILALSIVTIAVCAAVGVSMAWLMGIGSGLSESDQLTLGQMLVRAGDDLVVSMAPDSVTAVVKTRETGDHVWANFFHALSSGSVGALMVCTLAFGLAFALQNWDSSRMLSGHFEAIYRAFEWLILQANILLPLLVFSLSAFAMATLGGKWLAVMSGFLAAFLSTVLLLVLFAFVLLKQHQRGGWGTLISAMAVPMSISLSSTGTVAAVPASIDAMSSRLGFNRGIVELVTPAAAVYLKSGEALFFAMMVVFIANFYGTPLGISDLAVVAAFSVWAAFASIGAPGGKALVAGSIAAGALDLPFEAVLVVFTIIEIVCEGPRNLLSLLTGSVIIAVSCRGLPSANIADESKRRTTRYEFLMSNRQALIAAVLLMCALFVTALAGVGQGLRNAESAAGAITVSPAAKENGLGLLRG